MFCFLMQSLAVLQQPPSNPEGVLLPAAAPPEDHRCRVGPSHCERRPGRFFATGLPVGKSLSSCGNNHLISSALHWHSSRFLVQPKMSHSQYTWSYNWGPFLCPGEAVVRQLQAVHRALPVPDEEHASDFPLHQRCCHYTLRAHAEVKSHRHHITHLPVPPYQEHAQPFTLTDTVRLQPVSHTLWRKQCLDSYQTEIS